MTSRQPYSRAPITEAIIDIRVKAPESVRLDQVEKLHESIQDEYPGKVARHLAHGRLTIGAQVSALASQMPIGYLFKSQDEKQIFQARLDGFTMSRLAPYESWEPFRDEARRLWQLYRDEVQPEEVTRLAVRYINRIDIPFPFDDLNEYLRTFPEVSADLPQTLAGLFMQLTIPQPDIESMTLLNEALIEPAKPDIASIVLDIDLFRQSNPPQGEVEIWKFFEVLRQRKNEIFEACITAKARKLF
ncbi:MAG: TIGR04255 family protein [Planctomycetaceae bacterium]